MHQLVVAGVALLTVATVVTLKLTLEGGKIARPSSSQPALRAAGVVESLVEPSEEECLAEFLQFIDKYGKQYRTQTERAARYKAFKANLKYIRETNAKGGRFSVGLNSKSDMSHDEFTAKYLPLTGAAMPQLMAFVSGAAELTTADTKALGRGKALLGAPKEVDWRSKGCVTPVRDQGECGSCWSFSAMGALEGAMCVASKKKPVELSVQQLVDCSRGYEGLEGGVLNGCHGGIPHVGFEWIMKNKQGVCSSADYPYVGKHQKCTKKCKPALPGIHKWHAVRPNDEKALMEVLATAGPVSIVLNASSRALKLLQDGVFDGECETDPNHAVLLVGYGSDPTKGDYWLIKNSWGDDWGKGGYGKIARGGPAEGVCGILSLSVFAVMNDKIVDDGSKPRPTRKPRKEEKEDEDEDREDKRRRKRRDGKDKKKRDHDEPDYDDDDSDFVGGGAWEVNYDLPEDDLPELFIGDEYEY